VDQQFDVIVIGGGTMGSAAAWELGKRGLSTLVLEQFSHIHDFGSHGGRTRVIRHAYAESPDYVPLVQRADALWLALEEESGRKILHRTGGLELAAPGFHHTRAARESADTHNLPYEWLTPAAANERWPGLRVPDDWDVLFSPQTGFLLTEAALSALRDVAEEHGVRFQVEEPVREWGATATHAWVRTDRTKYQADRLIVTAGAWAPEVLADLNLPLTVKRKVLWWLDVADPKPFALGRFPVFIADSEFGEIYGFPIHDRFGLKIANHAGGEATTAGSVDRSVAKSDNADVVGLAQTLFTGVTNNVLDQMVCLYTATPDSDFIIDRHPLWPRVTFAAGFSGHGFKFATAIGEHLADLALEAKITAYPRFALRRLAIPAPAAEPRVSERSVETH